MGTYVHVDLPRELVAEMLEVPLSEVHIFHEVTDLAETLYGELADSTSPEGVLLSAAESYLCKKVDIRHWYAYGLGKLTAGQNAYKQDDEDDFEKECWEGAIRYSSDGIKKPYAEFILQHLDKVTRVYTR